MPYPEDALAPHEELILNLHPHWWYIAKAAIILVLTVVLLGGGTFAIDSDSALRTPLSYLVSLVILVEVVWFLSRFIRWISTFFVLTSDRIMSREGVFAKRGIEIPLERILGLGDLESESASKEGAQVFDDVRRPSDIQKEIYIQMERNENRKSDHLGQVIAGAQQHVQAAAAPSISDQINQLALLRDQGHLTEAEFQAKKAELLSRM